MIDHGKLIQARRERAEALALMLGDDHPLTVEAREQANDWTEIEIDGDAHLSYIMPNGGEMENVETRKNEIEQFDWTL